MRKSTTIGFKKCPNCSGLRLETLRDCRNTNCLINRLEAAEAKLAKVEKLPARWKTYGHTTEQVAMAYEILSNELREALK
jgi:hypothetical protein